MIRLTFHVFAMVYFHNVGVANFRSCCLKLADHCYSFLTEIGIFIKLPDNPDIKCYNCSLMKRIAVCGLWS